MTRHRRAAAMLSFAAAGVGMVAGGCTVGDGNGVARGPIYLLGCSPGNNFGTKEMPRVFDLSPRFFAGEPIEEIADVAVAVPANRLLMRLQRNGNRIEVNDTLYMDVQNTYEVARCLRGRIKPEDGTPDYLSNNTFSPFTRLPTNTPWCDWSGATGNPDAGDADGGYADGGDGDAGVGPAPGATHARIHLGTEEIVRSSLSLLFTCHKANVVGLAFDGWIDFQDFGGAAQSDRPPIMRDPILKTFKINYGDRLRATFHITLGDQRIVQAVKDVRPMPMPLIGGELDGSFDFDLERGRAAQPFP